MALKIKSLAEGYGSLSERVFQSLRQAILSMEMAPGERIDKKALAKQLGVSLFPVSEAITQLSSEGIVEVYPQAGTYVASFSMREIQEGWFLRVALETAAIERVAEIATDEQIVELERNFRIQEMLANDGDGDGFFALDEKMHELILSATGYPKLVSLTQTVWLQAERARHLFAKSHGSALAALEEHRVLIRAIAEHNPEKARQGMKTHLERVAGELRQLGDKRPDLFDLGKEKNTFKAN